MHHKFEIIDNKYIFNGSLNENILFLENKQKVNQFNIQFEELFW